jgi:hypothetical protein
LFEFLNAREKKKKFAVQLEKEFSFTLVKEYINGTKLLEEEDKD